MTLGIKYQKACKFLLFQLLPALEAELIFFLHEIKKKKGEGSFILALCILIN